MQFAVIEQQGWGINFYLYYLKILIFLITIRIYCYKNTAIALGTEEAFILGTNKAKLMYLFYMFFSPLYHLWISAKYRDDIQ